MEIRTKYHFYKKELSKLLKNYGSISFHQDEEILNRILNLLTEDKQIDKIKGILFTTEVVKYGGDLTDEETNEIYEEIVDWFEEKK